MPRILRESEWPEPAPVTPPRQMCYQGGTIIIDLFTGDDTELVLPSDVLSATGDFFGNGLKDAWTSEAETVTDPATKEEVKVLEYMLVYKQGDGIIMLDTTDSNVGDMRADIPIWIGGCGSTEHFYLSAMASGFCDRVDKCSCTSTKLTISQREHGAAFLLLFEQCLAQDWDLSYEEIADIVALSELYDFFHLIAIPLRQYLLTKSDLWSDVRRNYCFHLSLALKLRCVEVYSDALRHYIGSGTSVRMLKDLKLDAEQVTRIVEKGEEFQHEMDEFESRIWTLTMAPYVPREFNDDGELEYGETVFKTTFLSSTSEPTVFDHSQDIARTIVMGWLNLHLHGTKHWSHIRDYDAYNGVFYQDSLRNICNLATEARESGKELDLFEPNAARKSIELSSLVYPEQKRYMIHFVEEELKKLVGEIASQALPYIAPPTFTPTTRCSVKQGESNISMRGSKNGRARRARGRGSPCGRWCNQHEEVYEHKCPFQRYGMTANNDTNCHYFTCIEIDEEKDMPWEKDFEAIKIEGLEAANEAWLVTIGLQEGDEEEG